MPHKYVRVGTSDGVAWVKSSRPADMADVDSVAFDCDGVLVDVSDSYDAAIATVTDQLLRMGLGLRLPWNRLAPSLVSQLRGTGRFNNDWDAVYSLAIFSLLAHRGQGSTIDATVRRLRRLVARFCSRSWPKDSTPKRAVDGFAASLGLSNVELRAFARFRRFLGYPEPPPKGLLTTLFDETYHGPKLFRKLTGRTPRYHNRKGLIESERLLVTANDLLHFQQMAGARRLVLLTGRPRAVAEYTLGKLMRLFNARASVFIGDADMRLHAGLRTLIAQKPDPKTLIGVMGKLGSTRLLYIGDGAEDIIMANRAKRERNGVLFAGVYGTTHNPSMQIQFFRRNGADFIVPTARAILHFSTSKLSSHAET